MKLRSREINIFSMSALDLFASAMGAFMLLTIMALPFFPNTGDSPELIAGVRDELERAQVELEIAEVELAQTQGELADAEQENIEVSQELVKVKIPDLDIVICLDISGSMSGQIEQLKQQIVDLANVLDSLAPSVGIGVVGFGDRYYDRPLTTFNIVSTSNIAAIQSFVDELTANMGIGDGENPDLPEALYSSLNQAIGLNWRAESERRYIVVISDAAAYPEYHDNAYDSARTFNSNTSVQHYISTVMSGPTIQELRRDNANAERIASMRMAEDFLSQLAASGQGEYVDSRSGQSMLASIIMAIVNI